VARLLLRYSANLNATPVSGRLRGLTPLQVAARKGYQEMVELLKNALTSTPTTTTTTTATTMTASPKQAMAKSCDSHYECETTQACSGGQWAPPMTSGTCVDLCFCENCNKGVNNARDFGGKTPLHRAAQENSAFAAKLLIENSANVDSTDNDGETALHRAAWKNSVDVAKLLLEKSANLFIWLQ